MRERVVTITRVFLFWICYFWIARGLFLAYHGSHSSRLPLSDLLETYSQGFRLDASAAAYLTAVPAVALILSAIRPLIRLTAWIVRLWAILAIAGSALLIAADLEIFRHWDRRIDGAVLAYLRTPREAWASTGGTPRLLLILMLATLAGTAFLVFRRAVIRPWDRFQPVSPLWAVPLILPLGLLVIPARGGLQLWPLTQSSAYFSNRPFANVAAQNAVWGFLDSVYRRQSDLTNHFHSMDDGEARAVVEAALAPTGPTAPSPLVRPRPNILVIFWESASARSFGSLGGIPNITPRFDSLAHEGILFRRFYASGDRTDKGLAAMMSGFPALPTGSILKIPSKGHALPKLAADLDTAGYHTAFYYGGELEFASLQAHLVEAGFDQIVGKDAFPRATLTSKWGAHDEVVANRLMADLDRAPEPFFSVWLTISSHEPFDPPGERRFSGTDWQSQYFSAMAYTDLVIGRLVDSARTRRWWDNTVIVILGDHGRRVVPLDEQAPLQDADTRFRVPMLWLGGALRSRDSVVDQIASQVDVAPTLIDLAGARPLKPYPWGRTLLQPIADPFAYYAFEGGFGIVTSRGSLVYDHRVGRVVSRAGAAAAGDERLGRALMQLTYQDYLDR